MAEENNQFTLMSVGLLGGLILSTVAFALNAFLLGYLLIRYTSAWLTYRSYAITSAALIAAVWLTLLIGASVLLPRERVATKYRQFGSLVSIVTISVVGFITAASVCAIGLAQTQRTLTSDLRIVRTFFGTILALTFLSFLWVLISGWMALRRSRLSFYSEELTEEAARKKASELPEELKRLRQQSDKLQAQAAKAQEDAKRAKAEAELAAKKRATTEEGVRVYQETMRVAREAIEKANKATDDANNATKRENELATTLADKAKDLPSLPVSEEVSEERMKRIENKRKQDDLENRLNKASQPVATEPYQPGMTRGRYGRRY
jgi:methyl-accepting chemotaxis protein